MAFDILYINALITALFVYGIYTAIYKWNPLADFIQSILLGGTFAVAFITGIQTIIRVNWTPLVNGDMMMLGPIFLGLLYFSYFFRQTAIIYRLLISLILATNFGMQLPYSFSTQWSWITGYASKAATLDIGDIVAMVAFGLCLTVFLFSEKTDKPLKIPRTLGRAALFVYAAMTAVQIFVGNSNMVMFSTITVWSGPAWWVPIIIFAFVVLDALGGLEPLKKRLSKPVTP